MVGLFVSNVLLIFFFMRFSVWSWMLKWWVFVLFRIVIIVFDLLEDEVGFFLVILVFEMLNICFRIIGLSLDV